VSRIVYTKTFVGKQIFTTQKTRNFLRALPIVKEIEPLLNRSLNGFLFPGSHSASVPGEPSVRRLNAEYAKKASTKPPEAT